MEPRIPTQFAPVEALKVMLCPHSSQPEILAILTPKPVSTPFLCPQARFRLGHCPLFTGWQLSPWSSSPLSLIYSAFFPKQSSKNTRLLPSHHSMTVQWLFVAFSIKSRNCLTKPLRTRPDTLLSTLTYFPSPSCSVHISNTNSLLIPEHLNLFSTQVAVQAAPSAQSPLTPDLAPPYSLKYRPAVISSEMSLSTLG